MGHVKIISQHAMNLTNFPPKAFRIVKDKECKSFGLLAHYRDGEL